MILPIYTYGQAVLREETKPIDSSYPELQQLIADMFETMYNADGIGLAAPQIGRSIRQTTPSAQLMPTAHRWPTITWTAKTSNAC